MNEYKVTMRVLTKKDVTVYADSASEALRIANNRYERGVYLFDTPSYRNRSPVMFSTLSDNKDRLTRTVQFVGNE